MPHPVRDREQPSKPATILVKVVATDRDGRPLHEGQLNTAFHTRQAALETIRQHLHHFDRTGYDPGGDYWWGRCLREPCQKTLFLIR